MNNLLQLNGQFYRNSNPNRGFHASIGKNVIHHEDVEKMCECLARIISYWKESRLIDGVLFSVHYKRVVPKSKRISSLFPTKSKTLNDNVVGARFESVPGSSENEEIRHVLTYVISIQSAESALQTLNNICTVLKKYYSSGFTQNDLDHCASNRKGLDWEGIIKKSRFINAISDLGEVDSFQLDSMRPREEHTDYIVTFYKVGIEPAHLMKSAGLRIPESNKIAEDVWVLKKDDLDLLYDKYPYFISQAVINFNDLSAAEFSIFEKEFSIPDPADEPYIGVIDTGFDTEVYFSKWVETENLLPDGIELNMKDKRHGTAVSSIIVDGPSINPDLDDHCGRFKVKHFTVATADKFDATLIAGKIKKAVMDHPDIKVWNLSLGSPLSVNDNYISPIAAVIDELQAENDMLFVIAGTNLSPKYPDQKRIGAPADSLNSLVVNSVNQDGLPASYTREGPVLSFFRKPDVSFYGGDNYEPFWVYEPSGIARGAGTSFAAPWVTRKAAYLIYRLKMNREVAKALIIDSAAGWNTAADNINKVGFGIVPKRIEEIVQSEDDEIKFVLRGSIDSYETFAYTLPIPRNNNTFPYYARATLCYFPSCSRAQGVDYTSTEMDLKFGRVKINKNGKAEIKSINKNRQAEENDYTYEMDARKLFRKWDNVKHLSDELKDRPVPRKLYDEGMWGISILTKERINTENPYGMRFGIVITLKEMFGNNRFSEFIKLCTAKGWIVDEVDINVMNKITLLEEEEIVFD